MPLAPGNQLCPRLQGKYKQLRRIGKRAEKRALRGAVIRRLQLFLAQQHNNRRVLPLRRIGKCGAKGLKLRPLHIL